MSNETEVLWLDETRVVSLRELVDLSGLRETELLELVHSGAIPASGPPGAGYSFGAHVITVARTACRLRNDFELDTRGLSVALRLLERVRDLEEEIARLRAELPR
ncbi:MAG TPA: chaperone modulator CbpM [Steroidobacteraceae bacterium]|nr:chaperone modulator CbpM [Steroidobacteraceae bacterium]